MASEQQTAAEGEATATIRLLVPNLHMGSVIGKSGARIKEMQEASNARIVATEMLLPNSTERLVLVEGVPEAIRVATTHIGRILEAYPERNAGNIYYKPLPGFSAIDMVMRSRSRVRQNAESSTAQMATLVPKAPEANPYPLYGYGGNDMLQTQQIYIPNELVGAVIGKGGRKINEIRQGSGSHVKIEDAVPGAVERLVTLHGTFECNQIAVYLLHQRLEAEKQRLGKI